jgi:archaellum biogenesis protein FlaJ (TadC family)
MNPEGTIEEEAKNWSYFNRVTAETVGSIVATCILFILVPIIIRISLRGLAMTVLVLSVFVCAVITISLYGSASTAIAKKGGAKKKLDKVKKLKTAGLYIGMLMMVLCVDIIITNKDKESIGFYGKLLAMSKRTNTSSAIIPGTSTPGI